MKNKFIIAGISAVLTAVLIVLVRFVNVAPIGPEGTVIGLARLNKAVFDFLGTNMVWYEITDVIGKLSLLVAAGFAALGLYQLIRRKSLLAVDREILALAALYAVLVAVYVLFEIVIVNYRPILMPDGDGPEASFPSSHTMLTCVIMGSALLLAGRYVRVKWLSVTLQSLCGVIMAVMVVGRLLSGVHWYTDVVGGVLISTTLLALYSGVLIKLGRPKKKRRPVAEKQ